MARFVSRTDPRIRRTIALVALVLILAGVAWQAFAQSAAPEAKPDDKIAGWNQALEKLDNQLQNANAADADLQRMRDQTSDIATNAMAFAQSLAPGVANAQAQVEQLTPAKNATAPESPDAKQTREAAQADLASLVGTQKQAQAVATHANYTLQQISDRRRALFTARLLSRNSSLINPSLWGDAVAELPIQASRTGSLLSEWSAAMQQGNGRSVAAIAVIFVILVIAAVLVPGRRFLLSKLRRDRPDGDPTERTKLLSAALIVGLNALLPPAVLMGARAVLQSLDLMTLRADLGWLGITGAVTFFGLGFGLIRAFLAPTRPRWRLIGIDDWMAGKLFVAATIACVLQSIQIFSETFARINYASLSFTIALQGSLSIAIAVLVLAAVRTANRQAGAPESEDADADDASAKGGIWHVVLVLGGIAAAVSIAANLFGYVSLGRFVTSQLVWVGIVVALLRLLMRLCDEVTASSFSRTGFLGSRMIAIMGLAPRSANQIGVILNGAIQLALIVLAVLSVTAPWGVDSSSVFDSVQVLFFGFKIGSLTVSLSTIVAGVAVFVIGVVITRAVQNWLDTRLLPTTRLDSGIRNSIQTGAGYLGMIIAATVAFGYAGLDLSNIAIVAGALSVGIGLGLQAIVNNFVSGVILLVERPIRSGDWVSVGSEEGTVKRINVRATEIETFDRSTLIVPNSTLITGPVKNMVLRDRSGRIIVPISVSKLSDADVVKGILLDAAKGHNLVLRYPEPAVYFVGFGTTSLDFELRCYLTDISNGFAVRSDIRFEVLRQLRAKEIALPA